MKNWNAVLLLLLTFLIAELTFAIETPVVLPKGIRSAIVRGGKYSGLNQYYTEDGKLEFLSNKNSFELDGKSLSEVNSAFSDLVRVLNEFGHSDLGSQLHLGEMRVQADPQVRYYAPTLAYGLTRKLTVGLGVPIINYQNQIAFSEGGSNLAYVQAQVGTSITDINTAFTQLQGAVGQGVNGALASKGYKPLTSKDETFVGDLVLFSAYKFDDYLLGNVTHSVRIMANLPTGPKADPDDLADLENFGRYSFKALWLAQKPFLKKANIIASASYMFVPEQNATKRVPLNSSDILPDQNQKMGLKEDIGDSIGASAGFDYVFNQKWDIASTLGYEHKLEDSYSGAPNGRGRFLEKGTSRSAEIARVQVTYSSVQAYLNKKSPIPSLVAYEISKTVAGSNVENQTTHEITLSLFF